MRLHAKELRTQETKRPRVGPRDRESDQETESRTAGRVPILSSRNRASPTSVLADEKVMLEKEPILALAEEKEIIGLMSSPAEEEPYITSTKSQFALLGELKDAEAATEAADSLDKMSGWPKGGIASAGKIVDNMSCVRRAQGRRRRDRGAGACLRLHRRPSAPATRATGTAHQPPHCRRRSKIQGVRLYTRCRMICHACRCY